MLRSLSLPLALTALCLLTAPAQAIERAHYSEFPDATWSPESQARPPLGAIARPDTTLEALLAGIHSFSADHESTLRLRQGQGGLLVLDEAEPNQERASSWMIGSRVLYRDGHPVHNVGGIAAEEMADGRVLISASRPADYYLAVALRAYDVSGLPMRQFLRDSNNLPSPVAWFMPESARFPNGSVAYQATWWLGDDEVIVSSRSAFTGATSLPLLINRYSAPSRFCLSYVNHQRAQPYGLVFDPPSDASGTLEGSFRLRPVARGLFCEEDSSPEAAKLPPAGGRWRVRQVRGTQVLELLPDPKVATSDIGVHPVNAAAVTIAFAEVETAPPAPVATGRRPAQPPAKGKRPAPPPGRQVLPARILRNNQPITDFRLRFNDTAADALRRELPLAETERRNWEEAHRDDAP